MQLIKKDTGLNLKMSLISEENKKEIFYNLINSAIAFSLVFFGSLTTGQVTITSLIASIAAAAIVAITKFKKYWENEEKEYCQSKLFSFF